jgi:uncharacterized protein (DUF736 family)
MSDYDDTNRGALFREKDKLSEKHPDYSGSLNVGGTEYYISGWLKESKAGQKFMSLSVKPKSEKRGAPAKAARQDADEDLPF